MKRRKTSLLGIISKKILEVLVKEAFRRYLRKRFKQTLRGRVMKSFKLIDIHFSWDMKCFGILLCGVVEYFPEEDMSVMTPLLYVDISPDETIVSGLYLESFAEEYS